MEKPLHFIKISKHAHRPYQAVIFHQLLISLIPIGQSLSWVVSPSLYVVSPFDSCHRMKTWLLVSSSNIFTFITDFWNSHFAPCIFVHQHIPSHKSSQLKYTAMHWLPSHTGTGVKVRGHIHIHLCIFYVDAKTYKCNK